MVGAFTWSFGGNSIFDSGYHCNFKSATRQHQLHALDLHNKRPDLLNESLIRWIYRVELFLHRCNEQYSYFTAFSLASVSSVCNDNLLRPSLLPIQVQIKPMQQ
jgi:hypothetical protein